MVDDTATLLRYTPLLVAGLALFSASISADQVALQLVGVERAAADAWRG